MRILLFGKNGQIGWELSRSLLSLGELTAFARADADLEKLDDITLHLRREAPNIIVNAAAYTAVDKAESEPAKAQRINAEAVARMAEEARRLDACLVHFSTDYVFDGQKREAYVETDLVGPLNTYGQTKKNGEDAIRQAGCRHLILRTSWIFASRGVNFVRTILKLAQEKDEIRVVSDQIGAPTSAELVADVTAWCLRQIVQAESNGEVALGTYHLVAAGETNWCDYARLVLAEAERLGVPLRATAANVNPISAVSFPSPAPRPRNSRLDTGKLRKAFSIVLPEWQTGVRRVVAQLASQTR